MLNDWLFGLLCVVLLFNIIITWILSFDVPNDIINPVLYIIQNKSILFSFYILSVVLILILFGLNHWFKDPYSIGILPLSLSGIFLYSTSLLLLSSFFVSTPTITNETRFVDTHPLIFYTAIFYMFLEFISSLTLTLKRKIQVTKITKDKTFMINE